MMNVSTRLQIPLDKSVKTAIANIPAMREICINDTGSQTSPQYIIQDRSFVLRTWFITRRREFT